MSDPENTIDIPNSKVDMDQLIQSIQERVQIRRSEAADQGVDYDALVHDMDTHDANRLPLSFYDKLKALRDLASSPTIAVAMYDPHLPLVNSWFLRAKGKLHGIIVDYVNRLGKQQVIYNQETENVITELAEFTEGALLHFESLEREVVILRQRVAILERTQKGQ